jgi:pyruvate formate lyase activating enzyme
MNPKIETGLIFDIQGYSVHDGPGCRTLIFMAGCPLRCPWCANPEGQLFKPRLMCRETKCTCGLARCVEKCARRAITATDQKTPIAINRLLCEGCETFDCVGVCYTEALTMTGKFYTVSELLRVIRRDSEYWGEGGGVTLGGGDPIAQAEFALSVLLECKKLSIHTAIETSAQVKTEQFLELMAAVDFGYIDIKHMDREKHRLATGVTNDLILQNIRALTGSGWPGRLVIRLCIIPGYNDTYDNLRATARFMKGAGLWEINLLPFHRLGESKYRQLGMQYKFAEAEPPTREFMETCRLVIENEGLACSVVR